MRIELYVAAVACGLLAACGGASTTSTSHSPSIAGPTTTITGAAPPPPKSSPKSPPPKPAPSPGSLPQTHQLPSAATHAFHAEMDALWHGVQTGSYRPALPAFFPLGAYIQVKAIADPVADYQARLVGGYKLDVAAAHALLGPDAPRAALLAVNVPDAYAHWVPPGACYNRVGCAELAARVSSRRFCAVVRDRVVDLVARGLVRGPPRRGGAFRSGWGGRRSEQRTGSAGALLHLLRRRLRDAAAG